MKEVNDKKESMKPMSQAAVELDDEALDQVSGGLKRLDSDWKPEITEICKLCGSTRNVRGGCKNKYSRNLHASPLCRDICKNKNLPQINSKSLFKHALTAKERINLKRYYAFTRKNKDRRSKAGCK